jgi:hypothetical protein
MGPRIDVNPGMIKLPDGGEACGRNLTIEALNTNLVIITDRIVLAFEKGVATQADIALNTAQFEATVLHELVHWVRVVAKLASSENILDDPDPDVYGEAGELFEKWAYDRGYCVEKDLQEGDMTYR